MLGEPLPPTPAPSATAGRGVLCLGRRRRIAVGRSLGLLVGEETELVGIGALAPGTILAAEELLDLVLKLLDPPTGLPDRVRLLADDLVAEGQFVGQGRGRLAHARIVRPRATSKRGPPAKISCGLPLVTRLPP